MGSLHTNINIQRLLKTLSVKTSVIIGVTAFVVTSYVLVFLVPKQVAYAYSSETCVRQLTLFPGVMRHTDNGFGVTFKDSVSVGGASLFSLRTCFAPSTAPAAGSMTVNVAPLGGVIGVKHYKITVPEPISARSSDFIGKTLPLTHPVIITLSGADEIFSYSLVVGDKKTVCDHNDSHLSCDISTLGLAQGQQYDVALDRNFDGEKVATIAKGTISTLKALAQTNASVKEGQMVYDIPTAFRFEYDKPLETASAEVQMKTGNTLAVVASKTTTDGKAVIVTLDAPLPRDAAFVLVIHKAEGTDGSSLPAEYSVNFNVSGGPKVTGVSVGAISAPLSGTTVLTFDQEIANPAATAQLVSVKGIDMQVVKSGNTLRLSYANAPKCTTYTITIAKGLMSGAGVTQVNAWSFTGRTQCYTTQSIGLSQQGRAIIAYVFGSGTNTILYTGAIHGNEQSARLLMNAWINEIETNPQNIPANTQLVIIPSVNPDGVAANTRYNAGGIDLNRNFNTSDWSTDVQTVNGQPLPGGGGSAPESEPETQALVAYTRALVPSLTMSYHAAAAYVIANTCGNSGSLAASYASMVGYRDMTGVPGAFGYEITGTYDDWMCERLGYRSVLVELTTNTNSEFSRHKAALWAMARS